jgi:protein-S-isoprenylcysteine O-methyltransferase Ste14
MQKRTAVLGSALFFVVAPLMFAGVGPWLLTHWEIGPAFLGFDAFRIIGCVLLVIGVAGLIDSFARFALQGLGTPAPVAPPEKLVVTGLYRYVRNPMYVAALAVVFGQALLFGDVRLLAYGAIFGIAAHIFVVAYEERRLERTFGAQYRSFRANVPRWIPRFSPWRAG